MIHAVVLKLSPELARALSKQLDDIAIREAISRKVFDSHDGFTVTVSAVDAENWVGFWYDGEALQEYLETDGECHPGYPGNVTAPSLLSDFIDTILKIYRLTVSV